MEATAAGQVDCVRFLLKKGCKVNLQEISFQILRRFLTFFLLCTQILTIFTYLKIIFIIFQACKRSRWLYSCSSCARMQRFSNIQASSLQLRETVNFKQPKTNRKTTSERASGNCWRTVEQNNRRFNNLCRLFWTIKTVKILFGREKINRKRTLVDRAFPIDLELETRKRSIKQIQRRNYPKRKSTGSGDALYSKMKYILFIFIRPPVFLLKNGAKNKFFYTVDKKNFKICYLKTFVDFFIKNYKNIFLFCIYLFFEYNFKKSKMLVFF